MNISVDTIDAVANWFGLLLGIVVAILGWVQWRNREDFRVHLTTSMLTMLLGIVIALLSVVLHYTGTRIQARSDAEIGRLQMQSTTLSDQLNHIRTPRTLSEDQKQILRESLPLVPKGPVIVTYLSVATDAEKYSKQIGQVLEEAGFSVTSSNHLWLQLAFDGVYVCVRSQGTVPAHSAGIQNAFKAAGIMMKVFYNEIFLDKLGAPDNGIVVVVSNKAIDRD